MNKQVVELAKLFEEGPENLSQLLKVSDRLLGNRKDRDLTIRIIKELFLMPYITSKELTEKFAIGKGELIDTYSFIRTSKEIKDLFSLSSYPYLIKVLNNLIGERARTLEIINGKIPFPLTKTMELFISAACNAKCKFCYRGDGVYANQKILSSGEFIKIINEFADLKGENLDVCGGLEPLLGPAILEVLKAGLERKLKVGLFTNGIALDNSELLDYLLRIERIRVSLNAYSKENYQEIIGVDKFDKVKDNLATLMEAKKKTSSKVKIGFSFLVCKDNYTHILEVVNLAQQWKVDFLDLRTIHVTDSGVFDNAQKAELKGILKQIKAGALTEEYNGPYISIADTFNSIFSGDEDLKRLEKEFANALINFRVTVLPSGKVYALNVIAQPSREDPRYLYGEFNGKSNLSDILKTKKDIPFEPGLLLPHDISILAALSRLKSDLEFGIKLEESPFNFR